MVAYERRRYPYRFKSCHALFHGYGTFVTKDTDIRAPATLCRVGKHKTSHKGNVTRNSLDLIEIGQELNPKVPGIPRFLIVLRGRVIAVNSMTGPSGFS
jgi:hypothetical protein